MGATETNLHYLEFTELAARIRAREISPVAVTRSQLERIASVDAALGSYALVTVDVAVAASAEAEIAAGQLHHQASHSGRMAPVAKIGLTNAREQKSKLRAVGTDRSGPSLGRTRARSKR